MSETQTAEKEAPEENTTMAEATATAPRRPHRASAPKAPPRPARPPRAAAAPPTPQSTLPPKKGYIRLLCVQDYSHGHRLQIPPKLVKDLDGYADLDPKDIKAAVKQYVAGEEYYLEAGQAARLLRDKGPARYRNPITEKVERRKAADIYFRASDRDELEAYLDNELDKIAERGDTVGETDINDQNLPDDEGDDE